MKIPRMTALCLLLCSCGATPSNPSTPDRMSLAQNADRLIARGDYQSASYYIDAQLQQGGDERALLRRLVETQIRGDLLHAAMHSLRRLYALTPDNPQIRELFAVLCDVTGVSMALSPEEGEI